MDPNRFLNAIANQGTILAKNVPLDASDKDLLAEYTTTLEAMNSVTEQAKWYFYFAVQEYTSLQENIDNPETTAIQTTNARNLIVAHMAIANVIPSKTVELDQIVQFLFGLVTQGKQNLIDLFIDDFHFEATGLE